ncbi:LOW QUALITY PROTEIN: uncharacterized protein [Palaemon carinicauda]|uniref:LOW QUALITY PROTEIN: uncharacterized protein n=1 Tax=Palaemon carinicauda TaxID=392227 RepID=UPI0035B5FEB9
MVGCSSLCFMMEVARHFILTLLFITSWEAKGKVAGVSFGEHVHSFGEILSPHPRKLYSPIPSVQVLGGNREKEIGASGFAHHRRKRDGPTYDRKVSGNEDLLSTPRYRYLGRRVILPRSLRGSVLTHHQRHGHSRVPAWLKEYGSVLCPHSAEDNFQTNEIEDSIAAVFRGVAYGKKLSQADDKRFSSTGHRYERTTALSDTPDYNYVADESQPVLSGRRNTELDSTGRGEGIVASKESLNEISSGVPLIENLESKSEKDKSFFKSSTFNSKTDAQDSSEVNGDIEKSALNFSLENVENVTHDNEMVSVFEGEYDDFNENGFSKFSKRGHSLLANISLKNDSDIVKNMTSGDISKPPISPLSWFDYLLCTNRNIAWMLIHFLLGLFFVCVSIFAPYRLLSLRSCTQILPRTHFVCVHLLIFIAVSLKALYMFHLAFGGKERLPLVLVLILTNTSIPCYISVYLILIIMMFLTADVKVFKPKLLTMHNVSIFIVMMVVLSFLADIIVGSAHSKSVLMLSRLMLIGVTLAAIVFYLCKYPKVVQVIHVLKREFQEELKLLVVPPKDSPQQKQVNIRYILRNRLHKWCRVMNLTTSTIGFCFLLHFMHAIFLISSQVPAWVWWCVHVLGALSEVALGVLFCIAAALTQRFDEKSSFVSDLFVPSHLSNDKKQNGSKERNGNAVYQRVSYSSGTESTQYTACPSEVLPAGGTPITRTPKPPRRRTATVRRSATFSYAPQYPRAPGRPCQPPAPHINFVRGGSASQIPVYSPDSLSHITEIYSPASISHVPIYSPGNTRSMLVHEDGFVRIRTQIDCKDRYHRRSGSHLGIYYGHEPDIGSDPQIHTSNLQQWNGYGSRESFYHCLPRRRRSSRSSSFHQHGSVGVDKEFYPGSPRRVPLDQVNIQENFDPRFSEPNYQSFPRRRNRSRESSLKILNNVDPEKDDCIVIQNRRPSIQGVNLQHLNNLDRSEESYPSIGGRNLSHDDNNEPIYHNESSYHKYPAAKNISQHTPRLSPLNLSDQSAAVHMSPLSGSPPLRRKISNVSTSPYKNVNTPSAVHSPSGGMSPVISRREAHYPKPFSHRGSSSSLRSEDIPYIEHYQRTNPVRRNHSSAGYYPSRYLQPVDPSLMDDTQRYGSLRIGIAKKKKHGYVLHTNTSKLLNKYIDKYPRSASDQGGEVSEYGVPNKVCHASGSRDQTPVGEGDSSECDNSQSAANTSRGSDADWALELITSSSMLTDFYSLKRAKRKNEDIEEE